MDTHTDIQFTQGDSCQHTTTDVIVGHEHESGNISLAKDTIPENSYISDVHVDLATDTSDVTEKGQSLYGQGQWDTQPAGNQINHEHNGRISHDVFDEVLAAISEEAPMSDLPIVPANGSTSAVDRDGLEVPLIIPSQEPLLLPSWTASERNTRDDGETKADPDDGFNRIQMLDTEAVRANETDVAYPTDEQELREDFPSSQPPSSSPPQLFSSSPCAWSQSSVGDIEPSKADAEVEISASILDFPRTNDVEPVAQDESHLASEHLHDQGTIHVTTSTETAEHPFDMDPTLGVESPKPSKKRMTYQSDDDQSYGPQPTKRSKSGSHLYPPPAPMRATLASQSHQFKKLAAPFRPPSKLSVARDERVQTTNNNVIEPSELNHDKPDQKELSMHLLRPRHKQHCHKVSNASRSVSQFKSPLINKVASADTRTIRLTPTVQALERKLQLLKRAVKVKEDSEEEVLTKLAEKWTEAGREVAYDVWDATKDAGNFEEKAVLARRSYGWENNDNGNASWGWDTKREDVGEADSSTAICAADPLAAEEDDEDGFHNTLGTMLRQLGIAPEIFGWDDDKEAFCD